MKCQNTFAVCLSLVVLLVIAQPVTATILSVDFQNSATTTGQAPVDQAAPFQTFTELDAGAGKTYSTTFGDITVNVSGQDAAVDGFFNRSGGPTNGGGLTLADLYRDFVFNNSASPTIAFTFSGPGIVAGNTYNIGLYAYDSATSGTVNIGPGVDTSGSGGSISYTPALTTDAQYLFTSDYMTTGSSLQVLASSIAVNDLRVNGFEIFTVTTPPVPEPSTAMLLGLGLFGLAKYRRRNK